jgi:hypothetical protein
VIKWQWEGWLRSKVLRPTHFLDVKADRKVGGGGGSEGRQQKSGELKAKWGTKS